MSVDPKHIEEAKDIHNIVIDNVNDYYSAAEGEEPKLATLMVLVGLAESMSEVSTLFNNPVINAQINALKEVLGYVHQSNQYVKELEGEM